MKNVRHAMTTPKPERPRHTVAEKRNDIVLLRRRIADLEAFDVTQVAKRFSTPAVTSLETAVSSTLASIFGHGTTEYNRYRSATKLDHGAITMGGAWARGARDEASEAQRYLSEGRDQAVTLLRQAVQSLEEEIEFAVPETAGIDPPSATLSSRKVFVVHGHDEAAKHELARFLEQLELEVVILHEQPNQGRTIVEKFQEYANEVGFAVVLFTPDDIGGRVDSESQAARARQNVVFELGYFVAKLGRGKVCLLRKGDVEIPSDLYGVVYTDLDANGGWKLGLVKELHASGLPFDPKKVWG